MAVLPSILALLIGIAGWYYLFYSQAAQRLAGVENGRLNRMRVRLRRAGGLVLLLLAPCFFAGFHTVSADEQPRAFVYVWLTVFLLLATTILLAMVDLGLTWKLRRDRAAGSES